MSLKFKFRSVAIEKTCHRYSRKDVVSAHTAPLLLKTFGQLIESVEWRLAGNGSRALFSLLAKYCGNTLKKLKVTDYNPSFDKRNQFPALEQLALYNAEPQDFCLDSPLKCLEIQDFRHMEGLDSDNEPWFVREFPHLESVRFNTMEITDDTLTDFLSVNPQLRVLDVESEYLTPLVFEGIGYYSRNIERLLIKSVEFLEYDSGDLQEEMLNLSELRKLSELRVSGRVSLEVLLNMFAKNNVPIRSLEVDIAATDKATTSFPAIKTLNKLQCICRSDVDGSYLIDLAKSQPALQTLQIVNMGANITVGTIEKILRFSTSLTDLELSFCRSDVDLESYNRILMLVRNRVRVRIIVPKRRQVDVPADLLKMNRNWLRIMFD